MRGMFHGSGEYWWSNQTQIREHDGRRTMLSSALGMSSHTWGLGAMFKRSSWQTTLNIQLGLLYFRCTYWSYTIDEEEES